MEISEKLRGIPRLVENFAGVWAIEEQRARELYHRMMGANIALHVEAAQAAADIQPAPLKSMYALKDGVAIVQISGPLTKYGSSMMPASTTYARKDIRAAAQDAEAKAVLIHIDSPGGNAAGIDDLGQDIAALSAVKPTVAFIEDLGASAAYWAASQAGKIIANRSAFVGSIGVYAVVDDFSAHYAMKGIKTYLVKTGEMKGAGIEGTPITEEQLAEFRREVEAVHVMFVEAVAKGRRMSKAKVSELADGRVHIAAEALSLGLIDEIGTLDGAFSSLVKRVNGRSKATGANAKEVLMSGQLAEPVATGNLQVISAAASLQELKAEIPDSSADFREYCQEQGMTLAQAKAAWKREQQSSKALADAQAKQAAAEKKAADPGLKPVGDKPAAAGFSGSAAEAFEDEVNKRMVGNKPRHVAAQEVMQKRPDLHEAFVKEHNAQHGRPLGRFA